MNDSFGRLEGLAGELRKQTQSFREMAATLAAAREGKASPEGKKNVK